MIAHATAVPSLEAIAARAGIKAETLKGLCGEPNGGRARESVWSFLWRTEPGTIALMLDPIGGLAEANAKARKIARRGRNDVTEERVEGVASGVWLVPEAVLERLFPVAA